jgi:hypothetical protein
MKLKDIYKILITEQHDDDDMDVDDIIHGLDHGDLDGDQPEPETEPEDPETPEDPEEPYPKKQPIQPQQKKLSRTQLIKNKWKQEDPGISEQQMNDAIAFFNERKDRIKPYKPYGTIDPRTNRYYVNLPEITALVQRFPEMETTLSNDAKLKDMINYTWEQMSFYQNRIFQQAMEFDDENWVQGDYTEDQRIEMALQRWTKPFNRLINDGTLIVYRVECKSEAIALGALDHAIWRKYNVNAMSATKRNRLTFTRNGKTYVGGIDPDILRSIERKYAWNSQPWCVARPIGGEWGGNLWTNYRPGNAFYFVLDNSKPEWDDFHISALQAMLAGGYEITSMPNSTDRYKNWDEIVSIYPGLRDKQRLFPWFGTTPREKKELSLDTITFRKGDPYYFGAQSDAVHTTYIENNRYINNRDAFLTLSFTNRKLYVDKTTKENNDYKQRFLCTEPSDDPLGILNIIKNEKITIPGRGDTNLYKYLNDFILITREHVPEGILAIKLAIVGNNWRRLFTDISNGYTLCSTRDGQTRFNRIPKFGILDVDNQDWIKDVEYIQGKPRAYVHSVTNDDGTKTRKIYVFQIYSKSMGDQIVPNDYFYFLYRKEALTNRDSDLYMKGKFYNGSDGDTFIKEQVDSGSFIRI